MEKMILSPEKKWAALLTLLISLIIITPLCGLLFQCGCDWPWLGLDSNCNFYKLNEQYPCPWCASMFTGMLSTGLAIAGGVFVTLFPIEFSTFSFIKSCSRNEIVIRILSGLGFFFLIAISTASVATICQKYPFGLGRYLL